MRKFGRKRFNRLFDRLDAIAAHNALKLYLIGNHDSFSYTAKLPPKIEQYLKEHGYVIGEKYENDRLVVLHGHQGQYGKISWFVNILGVRVLHFLSIFYSPLFLVMENFYRKHFNFDRNETEEEVRHYYGLLRERTNQGRRLMICGHTHQPMADRKMRVINTGDWIESGTFVVERNNEFFVLQFISKKRINELYSLRI